MIYFYSGTPGSGKSLHVAYEIECWIKNGKNVIANFEINEDAIKPRWNRKKGQFISVTNGDMMVTYGKDKAMTKTPIDCLYGFALNYHKRNDRGQITERQTLLVIDEAQILFNSRAWQSNDRNDWITFFTQHRKYGYEIIMISQFERLLDRQIRGLFEYEINHKNINNYKWFGKLLGLLCGGKLFIAVTKWYGVKGQDSKVSAEFFRGKRKYYEMYNSYKIFTTDG